TFKSAFAVLQQERLGRRDTALDPAFADGHHLPEDGLIGCFLTTPARTTGRIAGPTLCKARRWRPAISAAIVLIIVGRAVLRDHSSVPRGQRKQSGSRVQRRISSRSLSVKRWPPRLRLRAA